MVAQTAFSSTPGFGVAIPKEEKLLRKCRVASTYANVCQNME